MPIAQTLNLSFTFRATHEPMKRSRLRYLNTMVDPGTKRNVTVIVYSADKSPLWAVDEV